MPHAASLAPNFSPEFEELRGVIRDTVRAEPRPIDDYYENEPLINEQRLPSKRFRLIFAGMLGEGGAPYTWTDENGVSNQTTLIAYANIKDYDSTPHSTRFYSLTLEGDVVTYEMLKELRKAQIVSDERKLNPNEIRQLIADIHDAN